MLKKLFAVSLALCLGLVFQTNARTVTGKVIAENDSTPLPGAFCYLKSLAKTLEAAVSDINGYFSVSTAEKGILNLEINLTGFNPAVIMIESGGNNLNLGDIPLSEGKILDELTVTANPVIESKGKTIIFPSIADVKASSSSISLFQKLPLAGLDANPINRTLSVDGGNPMILINGVPSSMDDVNALHPKDIEKIEFSRITPARYADRGTNGLISITLKKKK